MKKNIVKIAIIGLFTVLNFIGPIVPIYAANAVTHVSIPTQTVSAGQQFSINIVIEPHNDIVGAQFNLSFDPSLVSINGISEGNLLKQNRASTYFNPGQVNNATGTIVGSAGVITTPGQTVSAQGVFATITMTAKSPGICQLILSRVILGDTKAQAIATTVNNGKVEIIGITPQPPSGGGGGGGGTVRQSPTPISQTVIPVPAPGEIANSSVEKVPLQTEPVITAPSGVIEISPLIAKNDDLSISESKNNTTIIPSENVSFQDSELANDNIEESTFQMSLLIKMIGGAIAVIIIASSVIFFISSKSKAGRIPRLL